MANVTLKNIKKSFTPGVPVLNDVSFTIKDGELFFLLGPSGCGKSTLLRSIAGFYELDSGTIEFDGEDVSGLPPEKRHTAMVFQNYALWPHYDVFENIAFGPRIAGVKGAELKKVVMESLETVKLTELVHRKIASLSGGQQQRIALARALATSPKILLLDEPLSNLDARLRDVMREEIKRICNERKLTALYVTHDRREAMSMADCVAVMHKGKVSQIGTPEELYNFPENTFCAGFLGDVNLVQGKCVGQTFETPLGNYPIPEKYVGQKVVGAIRPERLHLSSGETPVSAVTFKAKIQRKSFFGDKSEWLCGTDFAEFLVSESAPPIRNIGDEVTLYFSVEDFRVIPEIEA